MIFRLPGDYPNFKSDITDIADLYEVLCLKSGRGRASFHEVYRLAAPGDDEFEISGIEDENDVFNNEKFDAVCGEIQRREQACGGKYPFALEEGGYSIQLISGKGSLNTIQYTYLLLATRLNMKTNRVHAEIDGTLLFEKLSAEVAKNYWGERAESMVFGTSAAGNFHAKVDDLCNSIGEGARCKNKNTSPPTEKDGKLDVAVWKSFADGMAAKLIGMGQCKTGLNWEQGLSQ